MEHPNAEILRAIADGKKMQYRRVIEVLGRKYTSIWYNFDAKDAKDVKDAEACCNLLQPLCAAAGKHEWRAAPKTIKIGQHEVPEPVREPLSRGQKFWVVNPFLGPEEFIWDGCIWAQHALGSGFVHLSEEDAQQYYEALKKSLELTK